MTATVRVAFVGCGIAWMVVMLYLAVRYRGFRPVGVTFAAPAFVLAWIGLVPRKNAVTIAVALAVPLLAFGYLLTAAARDARQARRADRPPD